MPAPNVEDPARLQAVRSVYLVLPERKDRGTSDAIRRALERHGIAVQAGPEGLKPTDVDAIVRFHEVWRWDLKLYLENLDIDVIDRVTGRPIATGTFRNSYFHTYPDLDETARRVVDGIYASPEP